MRIDSGHIFQKVVMKFHPNCGHLPISTFKVHIPNWGLILNSSLPTSTSKSSTNCLAWALKTIRNSLRLLVWNEGTISFLFLLNFAPETWGCNPRNQFTSAPYLRWSKCFRQAKVSENGTHQLFPCASSTSLSLLRLWGRKLRLEVSDLSIGPPNVCILCGFCTIFWKHLWNCMSDWIKNWRM